MRPMAVLAALTVLAFAAGYGGGFLQMRPPATQEAGASSPAKGEGEGPHYVELGQFVVPVLAGGRTTSYVLAQVTLEAEGAVQASALRRRLPQARSALLQGLYGLAGASVFEGPAIQLGAAARALRESVNEQLGRGMVKAVVIDRLLKQDNTRL
ncbi:flagellar basal body-associated FliL family protein [Azospirillum sp. TSO22-1]|uniref:flagellar basal body-associated FliL family protein n=1 Tax=Azospirillum sp. TSO22-1 TaxID=716789 RepID=UPI000D6131F8|nr:flagellar basal body-associated FliL family protein [Azospirillum sp. TSO22-1]PWC42568.1 hypothetical protein TSO221_21380 [Azospirillum sp. TSO22-1]